MMAGTSSFTHGAAFGLSCTPHIERKTHTDLRERPHPVDTLLHLAMTAILWVACLARAPGMVRAAPVPELLTLDLPATGDSSDSSISGDVPCRATGPRAKRVKEKGERSR